MKRKEVHVTYTSWDICNSDDLERNRYKENKKYEK